MKIFSKKPLKVLIIVIASLLVLTMLLTIIGPHIALAIARQDKVADSYNYSESFLNTYDDVRARLGERVEKLRASGVELEYDE